MGSLFATGYGIYKGFYDDLSDMEFGEMFSAGISTAVRLYKTSGEGMADAISALGATATNAKVPLEEQLAILGQLQVPTINLNIPSADAVRQQWQDALRPSLDAAISRRQSASQSIRAELDADAVSRGMGSSTYVSSLKERESAEAQDDIDELQAQYGATLAERIATSLQAYEQMRLNAQQYNLQAQAAAQQAALNLAGSWYSDYVAQQNALAQLQAKSYQSSTSSSRGSSGSSSGAKASSSLSADDYLTYVENLSSGQRKLLFSSGQSYWKVRREELEAALGTNTYQILRNRYLGQ